MSDIRKHARTFRIYDGERLGSTGVVRYSEKWREQALKLERPKFKSKLCLLLVTQSLASSLTSQSLSCLTYETEKTSVITLRVAVRTNPTLLVKPSAQRLAESALSKCYPATMTSFFIEASPSTVPSSGKKGTDWLWRAGRQTGTVEFISHMCLYAIYM